MVNTHVDCVACIVNKADKIADRFMESKHDKYEFMHEVMKEIINTDYNRTSPFLDAKIMRLIKEKTGIEDLYKNEKFYFNEKMLEMEPQIEQILDKSNNRLFDALKIASSGNIIDFSALSHIDFNFVRDIIDKTFANTFDKPLFDRFSIELERAGNVLYLGDNTGEVVLDKIFIKEIRKVNPECNIYFSTRGTYIFNDITEEDAYFAGIDKYAKIINNGSDLPGTDLLEVSDSFKEIFHSADIIISKGQGNFESLNGCGKNIYYLFMTKCDMIARKMNIEKFKNIFISDI